MDKDYTESRVIKVGPRVKEESMWFLAAAENFTNITNRKTLRSLHLLKKNFMHVNSERAVSLSHVVEQKNHQCVN